jgi:hypothetical protein
LLLAREGMSRSCVVDSVEEGKVEISIHVCPEHTQAVTAKIKEVLEHLGAKQKENIKTRGRT